jgi:hypothetical protein
MGNDLICGEHNIPSQSTSHIPLSSFTNPSKITTRSRIDRDSELPSVNPQTILVSRQVLGKVPYKVIEDYSRNQIVQAVIFEKERIFRDLKKEPVRKTMKAPNVSFASFRNLTDLWESLHIKKNGQENKINLKDSQYFSPHIKKSHNEKKYYSYRELPLKQSHVITDFNNKQGHLTNPNEYSKEGKILEKSIHINSNKQKSILKKKILRKVDMKKLEEFHTLIKGEFLRRKKAVHKENGIPKLVQNDCFTYLLRTGGRLIRSLFRQIRQKRIQAGMGDFTGAQFRIHVQGFLQR